MYNEGDNRIRIFDKLCYTVANKFKDNLISDEASKVQKVVNTSTILVPKTVMTWQRH